VFHSERIVEPEVPFEDLVKGIRQGDDQAAAALLRRYEPAIRRAIRFRMSDTRMNAVLDSMDVCQSVMGSFFIRAAAGQYELDSPTSVMQLLIGMAKKKLAMQVRHQRAQRRDNRKVAANGLDDAVIAAKGATASQYVAAGELMKAVQDRLTPEDQQILNWRNQNVEWTDIAARLNTTPEAIRKKFSRALDRIAVDLGLDEDE
jgi:DNA-directed RNA polymerase specialized sigma24 family protein